MLKHTDVVGYDELPALIMEGNKPELMRRLQILTDSSTWIQPRLTPGQVMELRRRQFGGLLNKRDFAGLLHISYQRYSDYMNSHMPVSIHVLRRAYAVGCRIEPLIRVEKPRDPFFSL